MPFEPGNPALFVEHGLAAFSFPQGDPADLLPPKRRPLLISMRQHRDDLRNLVGPSRERKDDELLPKKHRLEVELMRLTAPLGEGGFGLGEDDTPVADVRKKIADVSSEMTKLTELIEVRTARAHAAARLVKHLEDWLQSGHPSGTVVAVVADVDLRDCKRRGENDIAAVERLRHRLRELAADAHRVESAPWPAALAKARVREEIHAIARRGQPDVAPAVEAGAGIAWPKILQRMEVRAFAVADGAHVHGLAHEEVVDGTALLMWAHADQIIRKVELEIDALADDANALAPEARARRLSEIAADRLVVERQECELIRRLQADGTQVEYREDADPRALLAIELVVADFAADSELHGMAARAVQTIGVAAP